MAYESCDLWRLYICVVMVVSREEEEEEVGGGPDSSGIYSLFYIFSSSIDLRMPVKFQGSVSLPAISVN